MPFTINTLQRLAYGLAVLASGLVAGTAPAANCHIEALNEAQRYNFDYAPSYFEVSKTYALEVPYTVRPGAQLLYRKLGRKDLFLVPDVNLVYKPNWFLAITFKLAAGRQYLARANTDKTVDLHVIGMSGGQGNMQFLYVNKDGELCERVGSYSAPSGGFGPITTLVKGDYATTPAEAHLQLQEVIDANYSSATSITLDEDGSALLKLTLNVFNSKGVVERTEVKAFDKNATDNIQFESWRFSLRKQADGAYLATVLAQPN